MKKASSIGVALLMLLAIAPIAMAPLPVDPAEAPAKATTGYIPAEEPRHTAIIGFGVVNQGGPTVTVQPGDTYSKWAIAHCGNFGAWQAIQVVNKWPERRIPIGAKAIIECGTQTAAPTTAATPAVTGAWVHPLASGKLGNSCYRTPSRPNHGGVDMAQPTGTPIRSASAGTIHAKLYEAGGAGHYVLVKHANAIYTRYHHLRAASPLPAGASVFAGQTIGYVGATGNATGPHLHFEVMRGGGTNAYRINPATFMRDRGVNIGC